LPSWESGIKRQDIKISQEDKKLIPAKENLKSKAGLKTLRHGG